MADEAPAGRLHALANAIGEAVEDHEQRMHIPPPERGPLTAIPFPNLRMTDVQTSRVREMIETGSTLEEAAAAVDLPVSVLERCLSEFRPRWRRFLYERETVV